MRPSPASALYHPLDEVLGTRALVRVVRVLGVHGGSLAVADIAQRAKLSAPSVRSALRRLMELRVAASDGVARGAAVRLRMEHPLVPALVTLFTTEQQQADLVLRTVRETARRLSPRPWAVWLYGSVARGEDAPSSDIDIMLVTPAGDATGQADVLRDAVARTDAARADRVSVVTMEPEDLRRAARQRTPFWSNLRRDAVVLVGDAPAAALERAKSVAKR